MARPRANSWSFGWGSTYGPIHSAVTELARQGTTVSQMHLRYLNPLPSNLGEVLSRYDKVLVPEMNLGQLAFVLQGRYLREVVCQSKVEGQPFRESEILDRIRELA